LNQNLTSDCTRCSLHRDPDLTLSSSRSPVVLFSPGQISSSPCPYKSSTNPVGWVGVPRPLPGSSSPPFPYSPSARATSPLASTSPTSTSSHSARAPLLVTSSSETISAGSTASERPRGSGLSQLGEWVCDRGGGDERWRLHRAGHRRAGLDRVLRHPCYTRYVL
jgi:hypothetical protein